MERALLTPKSHPNPLDHQSKNTWIGSTSLIHRHLIKPHSIKAYPPRPLIRTTTLLTSLLLLASCAPPIAGSSFQLSSEFRNRIENAPNKQSLINPTLEYQKEHNLVPTIPSYQKYQIKDAKLTPLHQGPQAQLAAEVKIESNQSSETLLLVGDVRPDGTATLTELDNTSALGSRIAADAVCLDFPECHKTILDLSIKNGTHRDDYQFISPELSADNLKTPPTNESPSALEADTLHSSLKPDSAKKQSSAINGHRLSKDEVEFYGIGQAIDYVGAPRNLSQLEKLDEYESSVDRSSSDVNVRPSFQDEKSKTNTAPSLSNSNDKQNSHSQIPKEPEARTHVAVQNASSTTDSKVPLRDGSVTPSASKPSINGKLSLFDKEFLKKEKSVGPLLNTTTGGHSKRWFNSGWLNHSTALPLEGSSFKWIGNASNDARYSSGLMISLLVNSSNRYQKYVSADTILQIGDLSLNGGGEFGSHKSHQNGLDVDILYVGTTGETSIITSTGELDPRVDLSLTWQFMRIVASQKVLYKFDQPMTVLNRWFVSAPIKKAFESWADKNQILDNELDRELMRRLRVASGHDSHFHIRLRCSPHYIGCQNQVEPD